MANQISIAGEIKKIENSNLVEFTGLEFLLKGINKKNKKINLEVQKIALNFSNQFGAYLIKSDNLNSNNEFNEENASLTIEFSNFELQFKEVDSSDDYKVVLSEKVEVDYKIYKENS